MACSGIGAGCVCFFYLIDNFDFCSKIKEHLKYYEPEDTIRDRMYLFLTEDRNSLKPGQRYDEKYGISTCQILYNIFKCHQSKQHL